MKLVSQLILLFLATCCLTEPLITLERAKELKKIASWKVANPKKNPLAKYSKEDFVKKLKGTRFIPRNVLKTIKDVFGDMRKDQIDAILETPEPRDNKKSLLEKAKNFIALGKLKITRAVEDKGRKLQDDEYDDSWNYNDEENWWDEEDTGSSSSGSNTGNTNPTPTPTPAPVEEATGTDSSGLPKTFDGRKQWAGCIHSGGDQEHCNGCWAFGLANHLSDRFCIHGKDVVLSVQDILECSSGNDCCDGGIASNGYNYMMNKGAVAIDCKPVDFSCGSCRSLSCTRYKCKKGSMFWADTIQEAKEEIYYNGPIQGVYDCYDDFPYYEDGIYEATSKNFLGYHTVEILGWGTENGKDYWLCKNGWGDDWGNRSFFKIKMGDCGINEALTTCEPDV